MMLKQDENSTVGLRPRCCTAVATANTSANETDREDKRDTLVERLAMRVTNMDVDEEKAERHRRDMKEESCRRRRKEEVVQLNHRKCSIFDMTTSRSCRHSFCVSFILWTSVLLIFLTSGCTGEDRPRFERYPKYDHDSEVQGYVSPEAQNAYNVIHALRELIQRQQQQQQQQHRANQQQLQVNNNGEDLSENQIDWRKVPLPLWYQIRAIINDGSKEEDKRGSYMSLCHFKICNLG